MNFNNNLDSITVHQPQCGEVLPACGQSLQETEPQAYERLEREVIKVYRKTLTGGSLASLGEEHPFRHVIHSRKPLKFSGGEASAVPPEWQGNPDGYRFLHAQGSKIKSLRNLLLGEVREGMSACGRQVSEEEEARLSFQDLERCAHDLSQAESFPSVYYQAWQKQCLWLKSRLDRSFQELGRTERSRKLIATLELGFSGLCKSKEQGCQALEGFKAAFQSQGASWNDLFQLAKEEKKLHVLVFLLEKHDFPDFESFCRAFRHGEETFNQEETKQLIDIAWKYGCTQASYHVLCWLSSRLKELSPLQAEAFSQGPFQNTLKGFVPVAMGQGLWKEAFEIFALLKKISPPGQQQQLEENFIKVGQNKSCQYSEEEMKELWQALLMQGSREIFWLVAQRSSGVDARDHELEADKACLVYSTQVLQELTRAGKLSKKESLERFQWILQVDLSRCETEEEFSESFRRNIQAYVLAHVTKEERLRACNEVRDFLPDEWSQPRAHLRGQALIRELECSLGTSGAMTVG